MRKIVLLLAWLLALMGFGAPAQAGETYTLGVTPQFERRQLFAIWTPILKELEKRTGYSFELVLLPDIASFERGYNQGKYDFSYMNPYLIVANPQGYIPLVRDSAAVKGILVVAKDSSIQKVADLEGKTVAFPAPNAIGASLLIRAELARTYKVRINPSYVNSHTAVYLNVAQGLADAGGGVQKTLDEQKDAVKALLRVIHTTRAFPSHPIAAHPRVPDKAREAVQKALLDLAATPEGKTLLQEVPLARMIPAAPKDYEPLRELGLEDFFVPER
ncbi:MAG TPA: phosphate/phosphite/phosphonate ABC transporter substrate-binding protein [Rhodocyclaceae bacterium]|nr:phosphate/phosphite/phosphonate ABC transporter substrate-binding protein [Rhodocyclaceae bacterium]